MSELTCRELVAFLMDYTGGGLDAEQRREFESHLAECDDCVTYLRQYERTVAMGKAAFDHLDDPAEERVPPDLVQAILAARRKER